jgi:hypothetical protein
MLPLAPAGVQLLRVRAGYLSPEQLLFFEEQLFPGALAEFSHLAGLDARGLIKLECLLAPPLVPASATTAKQPSAAAALHVGPPRVLVPFGGGKDSTLLIELLSRMGATVAWCYMGEWVGSWAAYSNFERLARASPSTKVFKAEQVRPCRRGCCMGGSHQP